MNVLTLPHIAGCAFSILLLAAVPPFAIGQEVAEKTSPCSSLEHNQFSFWVGEWDVYPTGKDNIVAHSLIESVYGGCGVRENWKPLSGTGGGSLNIYVQKEDAWRQTWIDSKGARVDFIGGWNGKAMVLEGLWSDVLGPSKDALVRMTYSKAGDGSVRQLGEASQDGGKTWAPSFDLTYRQAKR